MWGSWRRRRRSTPSSTSSSSSSSTPTPSMNVYASGWYEPEGHRQYDTHRGNCHGRKNNKNGDTMMIRRHKGSRGSKRYHCVWTDTDSSGNFNASGQSNVGDTRDHIRYGGSNDKSSHHPCKGLGSAYMYQPGSSTFPGAHFGFKCTVSGSKIPGLISGNSGHINSAGATDSNNNRKTIKDQLLFGGTFREGGTGTGYCLQKENLAKKIGNETCFQLVSRRINEATANQKAREYCLTSEGRKDPKCRCLNVAGPTFLRDCKANPSWAGCNEVNAGIKSFADAGLNSATGLFGNADCIVPGICSGDVYKPLSNVPACANKTAICSQVMKLENVKAFAGVKATQGCNINFEAEQNKRDREKREAAAAAATAAKKKKDAAAAAAKRKRDAAAKKKRDAAAAAKRKRDAAAKKKRDAAAKKKTPAPASSSKKAPAASRTPSGSPAPAPAASSAAAPAVGGGLAKPGGMPQNTKIAIGVGGSVVLCCCLLLMMMMMGGGGSRRR